MSNRFPERNLNQTCIYWAAPIPDGYGGFSWANPIEVECRWIDSNRLITDTNGQEIIAETMVQVKQDLEQNGMMLLGILDDLNPIYFNDPVAAGAKSIVRFYKVPTIKGDRFYRAAWLTTSRVGVST